MPNLISYLMLLAWPFVTLWMFSVLPKDKALIWSILGGYLLLPPVADFNPPFLPDLDKVTIPNLSALAALAITSRSLPQLMPNSLAARGLLLIFILHPLGTILTNGDAVLFSAGGLPGLHLQELPSLVIGQAIIAIPFLLARTVLADNKSLRSLLVALVVGGLVYSIPMLIEIRLSPQINVFVYGFFQHNFDQMMRYGGFRPIVFLPHALWVALFAFLTLMSALTLMRTDNAKRGRYLLISFYLLAILILCKSAGVLIYITVMGPLLLLSRPTIQLRVAAALALTVLIYPLLRSIGAIPIQWITEQAYAMDAERAQSLVYRLTNEAVLIDHSALRPLFGWGGWGRNQVHDFTNGRVLSVVDGKWIETMSVYGWAGYLGEFGMLTYPLWVMVKSVRKRINGISSYSAALSMMLASNLVDLLPNATLVPLTWLMAGAVLGYAENPMVADLATTELRNEAARAPAPWARARTS